MTVYVTKQSMIHNVRLHNSLLKHAPDLKIFKHTSGIYLNADMNVGFPSVETFRDKLVHSKLCPTLESTEKVWKFFGNDYLET